MAGAKSHERLDGNVARRNIRDEKIIWDIELTGFGMRCRASGYKSWILKYQERGQPRFVTLGIARKLPASQARKEARRLLANAALDGLPRKPETAGQTTPTLTDYLPEFWRDYGRHWKPSTIAANESYIRRELLPAFGGMRLDQITRSDIMRWRDDLASRSGAFNRTLPILAVMLGYAEKLGYRPKRSNPCKGIRRYKRDLPERYLSDVEYRRLWRVLDEEGEEWPLSVAAIRLLLFTGARRGEITGLRWEYVQGDRIMLPDSKTGPKTIWLNAPARKVLDAVPDRQISGPVFHSDKRRKPLILGAHWNRIRRAAALPDVRLHDLRHSFASVAISDNISLATIGKLLGHALPETTARYAHLSDGVIADAAERVCSGLAAALEGSV